MQSENDDDDIHERPTLPDPLRIATPSDDFFATGVALDLAYRRQAMLVRCVGFVSLVAVVITVVAFALDATAFMHVR
jgi:hypothetical protein